MLRRAAVALLLLALVAPAVPAQTKGTAEAKAAYDRLVATLQAGDTFINYQALRFALADSPDFVSGGDREERQRMWAALDDKDAAKALSIAKKMLDADYTDIAAHLACRTAYEALGDARKAKFHVEVARGLVLSIVSSGDGRSLKTAMTVISIPEEHMAMNYLGLKPRGQALLHQDGHAYDRWGAEDKTGKTVEVYFNIDKFFGRYF